MGIFLIILGFAIIAIVIGVGIKRLREHKASGAHEFGKDHLLWLIGLCASAGIGGGILTNIGYALVGQWPIDPGHYAMLLIGGTVFYACMYCFGITFYLRYWRTDIVQPQMKHIGFLMVFSPILAVCAFLLAGEGMAIYLTYPLVKGFAINDKGFVWLRPDVSTSGGLQIQWYGVLIVLGAILAYKISDHNFYKKYGKHGILDSVFLLAFPAGILCARLWYVVGNWNGDGTETGINFAYECSQGRWWRIFAIWEGGLTILGGAVGGILVGSIFFIFRRRYSDLRFAFDAVVPNILLAQAIGRFGNFFNHEVYGAASPMSAWPLVPTWVRYNMATSWSGGMPVGNQMYAPMFIIEAVLNVIGFFVIAYGIPAVWKKGRALGDFLGFYLIWYGVVRIIMEPMRNSDFNMGSDGMWSVWNALAYIIMGAVAIAAMQIMAYVRKKKGLPVEMGTSPEQLRLAEQAAAEEAAKEEEPAPLMPTKKDTHKRDFAKPKAIPHPSAKKEEKDEPKE